MPLRLDDVVVLEAGRPLGAERVRRKGTVVVPGMSRRGFLRTVWVAGMGIGLVALGVFPAARKAYARDGHLIFPESKTDGPCAPDGYAADNECSPGCSRTPCVYCCIEDEAYDSGSYDEFAEFSDESGEAPGEFTDGSESEGSTSEETDPEETQDFTGYHRYDVDDVDAVSYSWRPNQCWGGTYDGWLWRCSPEIRYRCHDGYVTIEQAGTIATVCRWEA
jgi:hypothetical protein